MHQRVADFNSHQYKSDFPALSGTNRGKPLVFLDGAASQQKPRAVIDAMSQFNAENYANIHRGIYELSARATDLFENARQTVAQFINAEVNEVIFTKGTTEAINLVAHSFARLHWQAGDEVILTEMEHHANIVPWYLLKEQIGIVIKVVPVNDDGSLDLIAYQQLFSAKTRLVAVTHVSNVMGIVNPIEKMIALAREHNVPVLIDGAQAISHVAVDVKALDCDFYVFSAHKLYGPTGVGVLYAKQEWVKKLPPYQGGGGMIATVAFDNITFVEGPQKFEAGTPPITEAIGLMAAIHYLQQIGLKELAAHDAALLAYAEQQLSTIDGLTIIGTAKPKVGVISFVMASAHPHDIGTVLDHEGIAVRAGHHCAMPLMQRFNVPATVRISFGIFNDDADVDALIAALTIVKRLFG